MYKTVRKGDASLQYTILPQTDQFPSSGFPQTSGKARPRIIKYTMGTLMVLIVLSCVATPFLMNQNDQSLFASTVLAMGRVGHSTTARNSTRSQAKEISLNKSKGRLAVTAVASSTEVYRKQDAVEEVTTLLSVLKTEEQETENVSTTDSTFSTAQRLQTSSDPSTSIQQTPPSTALPSTSSATSSTSLNTLIGTPSDASRTPSSSPTRKAKLPRVTLKLRENETIPQMYMKAGIASYKKGNITTSVLAHGLSLEGLIFKTPEGTIKPWPQKWFFTAPSSDFQWKVQSPLQGLTLMLIKIYVVLAVLTCVCILLFCMHRKPTRRQRQSVEEPEVEGHEEDKSTLLGAESQETEEKE